MMCGEDYNYLSLTMYVVILKSINVTYIPIYYETIIVFKILMWVIEVLYNTKTFTFVLSIIE
jgi:hypothetical protein